jgi:hypothetical protein
VRTLVLVVAVAGCQQVFGLDDTVLSPDGPTSLSITGDILDQNNAGIAGATIRWETYPGLLIKAFTTTDSTGRYALIIPYDGTPLAGDFFAGKAGYIAEAIYPTAPLSTDMMANLTLLNQQDYPTLCMAYGVTCDPAAAFIYAQIYDAQNQAVAGVVVTSNPMGTVRYNANGQASSTATATDSDGIAGVFNVAVGQVVVSASKPGWMFEQQTVYARGTMITVAQLVGQLQ